MRANNINHLFNHLTFEKSADAIVVAAKTKVVKLKAKIEDRLKRVADLRQEYGIDDAALVQLLQAARKQASATSQYMYTTSVPNAGGAQMQERSIGAGVVNNLLTENDFVEAEKDQVARLEMIARNLAPIMRYASGNGAPYPAADFQLSMEELEYLGF